MSDDCMICEGHCGLLGCDGILVLTARNALKCPVCGSEWFHVTKTAGQGVAKTPKSRETTLRYPVTESAGQGLSPAARRQALRRKRIRHG